MILITDQNYHEVIGDGHSVIWNGEQRFFGKDPRRTPRNRIVEGASEMTLEPIPRDEWCDRIEQKDKDKSWAFDSFHHAGNKVLDQNGLSYCHAFSCADAMMIQRGREGLPYVELSAGSIGGPVTGFRNAGAAIEDDLRQAREHGAASTEFVPMKSHAQSDWKEGAKANALLHRVTHWWDLISREMLDQYVTALLMGYCVCIGYDWWSHAVTGVRLAPRKDLADLAAAIASGNTQRILAALKTLILNTWNESYGEKGFGWITDGKQLPNEAYVIAQMTPSSK